MQFETGGGWDGWKDRCPLSRTRHGGGKPLPLKSRSIRGEALRLFRSKGRATSGLRPGALPSYLRAGSEMTPNEASSGSRPRQAKVATPRILTARLGGFGPIRPSGSLTVKRRILRLVFLRTKTSSFDRGLRGPTEGKRPTIKRLGPLLDKVSPFQRRLSVLAPRSSALPSPSGGGRIGRIWDPPSCGRILKTHRCIPWRAAGNPLRRSVWRGIKAFMCIEPT